MAGGPATIALLCILQVGLSRADGPETRPVDVPFGEAVNGLQVGLEIDRAELCPGEFVSLRGHFRNLTKSDLVVPAHRVPIWLPGELRISGPGGAEFAYRPLETRPGGTFLRQGESRMMRKEDIRLTDPAPHWGGGKGPDPNNVSLRREGTYRAWFEVTAQAAPEAQKGVWSGTVKSNVVTFTVRELPPEKRSVAPTVEQWADLRLYLDPNSPEGQPALARLRQALLRTENEGLAMKLLEISQETDTFRGIRVPSEKRRDLRQALRMRAYQPCRFDGFGEAALPGIDGPYLEKFAALVLEQLEKPEYRDPNETRRGDASAEAMVLLAYLKFHPEDKGKLARAVEWAGKCARCLGPFRLGEEPKTKMLASAGFAWSFLLQLGVLHEGMTLEEAVKHLGEPTHKWVGHVRWYVNTPMHVNPSLDAEVKDGRIVKFVLGRA